MPRYDTQEMPYSEEAELSVLGAMLANGEGAVKVMEGAKPEYFYKRANRLIFTAARDLYTSGSDIEAIAISDRLKVMNELDNAGGMAYVGKLIDAVPNEDNVEQHIKIIKDKYIRRKVIKATEDIQDQALSSTQDTSTFLNSVESKFLSISADVDHGGPVQIRTILKDTMDEIEERIESDGSITGVHSGFGKLDRNTGGFKPSELTILAGRPSMGKTAFAVSTAINAATGHNTPVCLFSLEMSQSELMKRMLASKARVNAMKLQNGNLNDRELQRLSDACTILNEAPIHIDDNPNLSILDFRSKARRIKKEHDIGLFVIDYLQLMETDHLEGNRNLQIGQISRGAKIAARELETPVMMLSQLSRAPEMRNDHRPILSDLRESGNIEQDADVVMFVYRPELYYGPVGPEGENLEGRAEILLRKQRNGPTGNFRIKFEKEFTLFTEID